MREFVRERETRMELIIGRAGRASRPPDILVAVLALMPRDQVERLAQAAIDALDLGHDRDPDLEDEQDDDSQTEPALVPVSRPVSCSAPRPASSPGPVRRRRASAR